MTATWSLTLEQVSPAEWSGEGWRDRQSPAKPAENQRLFSAVYLFMIARICRCNQHKPGTARLPSEIDYCRVHLLFPRRRNEQGLTEFLPKVTDHVRVSGATNEMAKAFPPTELMRGPSRIHFHDRRDIQDCSVALDRIRKLTLSRKGLAP